MVMLLATHNVQRLRRLLTVSLRRGASPRAIISRIEDSLDRLYRPRGGFDGRELDVAFLAKALGGPRLLYALAHSYGLPSITTVNRHLKIPRLLPSIGIPTEKELSDNIESMCNSECKPPMLVQSPHHEPSGVLLGDQARRPTAAPLILMMDGIAIEERCRYSSERNSIIGLCREHSQTVGTLVTGFDVIQEAEAALHDLRPDGTTRCHYGKDATVVAVAPYARKDHYAPVPILVSASCKSESGDQLVHWMRNTIELWHTHPCGERLHGPIGALGSDGESAFRRARFILCMSELLDETAPLGQVLHALPGFNCYTGPRGVCGTCDPKHVIKRKLLRPTVQYWYMSSQELLKGLQHLLVI